MAVGRECGIANLNDCTPSRMQACALSQTEKGWDARKTVSHVPDHRQLAPEENRYHGGEI